MKKNADQLNILGIKAYKEGKLEEAELHYREALKILPMHPDTNHNLGALKLFTKNIPEALDLFKVATEANPNNAQFWLSYAAVLFNANQNVNAEISYKKVLELKPDNFISHNNLGAVQRRLNKLDDAVNSYKKALVLKPDYVEAHYNLGNLYHQLGRLKDAEASFKKTLEFEPNYAAVHNNLGVILGEQNRIDEAISSYKKAIESKPDLVYAHYNLGKILTGVNKLEEAEAEFKKTIELKPDFVEVYTNLSNLQLSLNRVEDAAVSYNKAIEYDPDFIVISNCINRGDWKNSKKLLQKICLKKILITKLIINVFISSWCQYSRKLLLQGDIKKLVKIFSKLIILDENNQDLDELKIFIFDSVDFDTILKLAELNDKILIKVSYCKYKYMKENFLISEELAALNIFDAASLISETKTEDIGWLIVRRSLSLCKNKNFARKTLNDFMANSITIK